MTRELELICHACEEKMILDLSDKEYGHYQRTGSLIENSEAYKEFFESCGWVLQQNVFCDICKYEHSECYSEDSGF